MIKRSQKQIKSSSDILPRPDSSYNISHPEQGSVQDLVVECSTIPLSENDSLFPGVGDFSIDISCSETLPDSNMSDTNAKLWDVNASHLYSKSIVAPIHKKEDHSELSKSKEYHEESYKQNPNLPDMGKSVPSSLLAINKDPFAILELPVSKLDSCISNQDLAYSETFINRHLEDRLLADNAINCDEVDFRILGKKYLENSGKSIDKSTVLHCPNGEKWSKNSILDEGDTQTQLNDFPLDELDVTRAHRSNLDYELGNKDIEESVMSPNIIDPFQHKCNCSNNEIKNEQSEILHYQYVPSKEREDCLSSFSVVASCSSSKQLPSVNVFTTFSPVDARKSNVSVYVSKKSVTTEIVSRSRSFIADEDQNVVANLALTKRLTPRPKTCPNSNLPRENDMGSKLTQSFINSNVPYTFGDLYNVKFNVKAMSPLSTSHVQNCSSADDTALACDSMQISNNLTQPQKNDKPMEFWEPNERELYKYIQNFGLSNVSSMHNLSSFAAQDKVSEHMITCFCSGKYSSFLSTQTNSSQFSQCGRNMSLPTSFYGGLSTNDYQSRPIFHSPYGKAGSYIQPSASPCKTFYVGSIPRYPIMHDKAHYISPSAPGKQQHLFNFQPLQPIDQVSAKTNSYMGRKDFAGRSYQHIKKVPTKENPLKPDKEKGSFCSLKHISHAKYSVSTNTKITTTKLQRRSKHSSLKGGNLDYNFMSKNRETSYVVENSDDTNQSFSQLASKKISNFGPFSMSESLYTKPHIGQVNKGQVGRDLNKPDVEDEELIDSIVKICNEPLAGVGREKDIMDEILNLPSEKYLDFLSDSSVSPDPLSIAATVIQDHLSGVATVNCKSSKYRVHNKKCINSSSNLTTHIIPTTTLLTASSNTLNASSKYMPANKKLCPILTSSKISKDIIPCLTTLNRDKKTSCRYTQMIDAVAETKLTFVSDKLVPSIKVFNRDFVGKNRLEFRLKELKGIDEYDPDLYSLESGGKENEKDVTEPSISTQNFKYKDALLKVTTSYCMETFDPRKTKLNLKRLQNVEKIPLCSICEIYDHNQSCIHIERLRIMVPNYSNKHNMKLRYRLNSGSEENFVNRTTNSDIYKDPFYGLDDKTNDRNIVQACVTDSPCEIRCDTEMESYPITPEPSPVLNINSTELWDNNSPLVCDTFNVVKPTRNTRNLNETGLLKVAPTDSFFVKVSCNSTHSQGLHTLSQSEPIPIMIESPDSICHKGVTNLNQRKTGDISMILTTKADKASWSTKFIGSNENKKTMPCNQSANENLKDNLSVDMLSLNIVIPKEKDLGNVETESISEDQPKYVNLNQIPHLVLTEASDSKQNTKFEPPEESVGSSDINNNKGKHSKKIPHSLIIEEIIYNLLYQMIDDVCNKSVLYDTRVEGSSFQLMCKQRQAQDGFGIDVNQKLHILRDIYEHKIPRWRQSVITLSRSSPRSGESQLCSESKEKPCFRNARLPVLTCCCPKITDLTRSKRRSTRLLVNGSKRYSSLKYKDFEVTVSPRKSTSNSVFSTSLRNEILKPTAARQCSHLIDTYFTSDPSISTDTSPHYSSSKSKSMRLSSSESNVENTKDHFYPTHAIDINGNQIGNKVLDQDSYLGGSIFSKCSDLAVSMVGSAMKDASSCHSTNAQTDNLIKIAVAKTRSNRNYKKFKSSSVKKLSKSSFGIDPDEDTIQKQVDCSVGNIFTKTHRNKGIFKDCKLSCAQDESFSLSGISLDYTSLLLNAERISIGLTESRKPNDLSIVSNKDIKQIKWPKSDDMIKKTKPIYHAKVENNDRLESNSPSFPTNQEAALDISCDFVHSNLKRWSRIENGQKNLKSERLRKNTIPLYSCTSKGNECSTNPTQNKDTGVSKVGKSKGNVTLASRRSLRICQQAKKRLTLFPKELHVSQDIADLPIHLSNMPGRYQLFSANVVSELSHNCVRKRREIDTYKSPMVNDVEESNSIPGRQNLTKLKYKQSLKVAKTFPTNRKTKHMKSSLFSIDKKNSSQCQKLVVSLSNCDFKFLPFTIDPSEELHFYKDNDVQVIENCKVEREIRISKGAMLKALKLMPMSKLNQEEEKMKRKRHYWTRHYTSTTFNKYDDVDNDYYKPSKLTKQVRH